MNKVHDISFGPYRLIINEINADRGIVPLVNVLRDPRFRSSKNCNEYRQVWSGDMIEFFDLMENATRPAWMK